MEQLLQTRSLRNGRDKLRLGAVPVSAGDADVAVGKRSPRSDSHPHLRLVDPEQPNVVPLFGQKRGATVALRPPLGDSPAATVLRGWVAQSLILEAIMRDDVGDTAAAEQAVQRALELAEDDRLLLPFMVDPVPALLVRYAGRCAAHADLIADVLDVVGATETNTPRQGSEALSEPLTESELRVLRLLPSNLSKREIGDQLYLSVHTIKTHVKHLYAKLDAHTRSEAVDRARELGLLTYSSRNR
jgi:LuxR family maltose regulon positive regulatory protein